MNKTVNSGASWLRTNGKTLSALGEKVANLLGVTFMGIHHLPKKRLDRVCWDNDYVLRLVVDFDLSTNDSSVLTCLVVLCHDQCIRLNITPWSNSSLMLIFTPRSRDGLTLRGMPTLENHLAIMENLRTTLNELNKNINT